MSEDQTPQVSVPEVQANFDKTVDLKDFKFRWKKDKLGAQRANVEFQAGVPSVEGVINILQAGGKQLELLQDAMYEVVRNAYSSYLADNEEADATKISFADFTWEKIANQDRTDRRSSSIPAETWEEFAKDYIAIMPSVTGKKEEAVATATTIYLKKFSLIKTNKPILGMLKGQLGLYMEHTKRAEEFEEILNLLIKKADAYLKADDIALLVENL